MNERAQKTDTIRKTKNRELFGCLRDNVNGAYTSQVSIWQTFSETVIKTDVITIICTDDKKKILYLVPLPNQVRWRKLHINYIMIYKRNIWNTQLTFMRHTDSVAWSLKKAWILFNQHKNIRHTILTNLVYDFLPKSWSITERLWMSG